ncbi:hypothetical protein LAZ67_8000531 [Cordylochernes scorpioides]|uniref:RNase H type-1 domain-containing protein n=1 Tax=Cordylochernes scorpioides TaxID=51811 RepID=A0ABY6KQB2_9ARAC|nr:hypothetical protein LAZ67_8000531 [Cordylochernes scorpioides]
MHDRGLRNTCLTKIADIEANLLPLTHRRKIGLADYINKRVNAPKSHRTGEFIRKWKPKPRLKRLTPIFKSCHFAIKNCYYSKDRLLKNIAAEINKLKKNTKISLQWIPSHVGVPGNEEADRLAKEGAAGHPDATLQLNRRESTQLARWKSGHLRPLVYKEGIKSFPMCTRCKTEEATPKYILNCI